MPLDVASGLLSPNEARAIEGLEPLTDDAKAAMQSMVNGYHSTFTRAVALQRDEICRIFAVPPRLVFGGRWPAANFETWADSVARELIASGWIPVDSTDLHSQRQKEIRRSRYQRRYERIRLRKLA